MTETGLPKKEDVSVALAGNGTMLYAWLAPGCAAVPSDASNIPSELEGKLPSSNVFG